MELIQRIRRQDADGAVADLFAADYVGALVGGLAFPFLLLPWLGQLTGALLTGAVNAVGGRRPRPLPVPPRPDPPRPRGCCWSPTSPCSPSSPPPPYSSTTSSGPRAARCTASDVRVALHTGVQEVVLTGGRDGAARPLPRRPAAGQRPRRAPLPRGAGPPRDDAGPTRACSSSAAATGWPRARCCATPDVRVGDRRRTRPGRRAAGPHGPGALRAQRPCLPTTAVRVVTADAFAWLRRAPTGTYDVVISDLPDPGITASTKLYSQEFYGLAARVLAPGGRLVVHAGPVASRPRIFWTVDATLRAAGFGTRPYRAHRPRSRASPPAPTARPAPARRAARLGLPPRRRRAGRRGLGLAPDGTAAAGAGARPRWRRGRAARASGRGVRGPAAVDAGAPAVHRLSTDRASVHGPKR